MKEECDVSFILPSATRDRPLKNGYIEQSPTLTKLDKVLNIHMKFW